MFGNSLLNGRCSTSIVGQGCNAVPPRGARRTPIVRPSRPRVGRARLIRKLLSVFSLRSCPCPTSSLARDPCKGGGGEGHENPRLNWWGMSPLVVVPLVSRSRAEKLGGGLSFVETVDVLFLIVGICCFYCPCFLSVGLGVNIISGVLLGFRQSAKLFSRSLIDGSFDLLFLFFSYVKTGKQGSIRVS